MTRKGSQSILNLNTVVGNDHAVEVGPISVHFRNLVMEMTEFIHKSDGIVGCIAWITHPDVLWSLTSCQCVSILMNKEEFLRHNRMGPTTSLLYETFCNSTGIQAHHHEPISTLCAEHRHVEPFRCVGSVGRGRPRLHHKFLVRLTRGYRRWEWVPTAVWTGSFNPTRNGAASLENAVVIRNRKIAEAFYWEWGQALAISDPMDWELPGVAPEYREYGMSAL